MKCGYYYLSILIIVKIVAAQVTSLLDHLIQLSKTGFSKATQRLDGIYALYAVSRLAAIDAKAGMSMIPIIPMIIYLYFQLSFLINII